MATHRIASEKKKQMKSKTYRQMLHTRELAHTQSATHGYAHTQLSRHQKYFDMRRSQKALKKNFQQCPISIFSNEINLNFSSANHSIFDQNLHTLIWQYISEHEFAKMFQYFRRFNC